MIHDCQVCLRSGKSQEKVKIFSGKEKVRKMQNWSGKFEKITKSQKKVRKNTKFSFIIQWYLQFYRHLFTKIFQPRCARHNFHFKFCQNSSLLRNDIFFKIFFRLWKNYLFQQWFCSVKQEHFQRNMWRNLQKVRKICPKWSGKNAKKDKKSGKKQKQFSVATLIALVQYTCSTWI